MKKVIIFIVVVLLVAGLAFVISKNISNENTNTQNTNVTNTTKQNTQSKTNTVKTNTVKNEVNNTVENIVNENVQETGSETFVESPETELEKAIAIVKADWGDTSAEYSSQGMDNNGNYIIQVANNAGGEVHAFYKVNVNNGTFTKQVIN